MNLCPHRKLRRNRANKASPMGLEHKAKAISVDKFDCLIFVVCAKCGKIMDIALDDSTFDSDKIGSVNRI